MLSSAVRTFGDPDEHAASIRAAHARILVTTPGEYRAELTRVDLHRLWMQASHTVSPHVVRYSVAHDRCVVFFLAEPDQAPIHHTGIELAPGEMMFDSLGSEHYHKVPADSHWRAMSLRPEDLAAVGRAIAGVDLSPPLANRCLRPPPHLMSRLSRLHGAVTRLAATVPDLLAQQEVAKALEQELLLTMVGCLTQGMSAGNERQAGQSMAVMRRFERLLEENQNRALYLAEICGAINVSERTLRLYCWEHLGMAPHRYLLLRRMSLARRALAAAALSSKTVTEIATEFGFWELGRFSVMYRQLFGETPSATLRRPHEHAPSAHGPALRPGLLMMRA